MDMAGKVLNLTDVIVEDQLGCRIAKNWMEWNSFRREWMEQKKELRQYVYATDTTTTSNSKLPWKNKTTIPKLCQIRDNLFANYMASMFPKRKWLKWEANNKDDNSVAKRDAIVNYMGWSIDQPQFKTEVEKLVLDYIDYGNCFGTVDWLDSTAVQEDGKTQVGYVGPVPKRISPVDIVFNPIAESFDRSPKIVRSLISLGEVMETITRFTTPENSEAMQALKEYMVSYRNSVQQFTGELKTVNDYYHVDGFDSYRAYLESDYVELLTFYGDIYDHETGKFERNQQIIVADRHKVISRGPHPSYFGTAPIFHCGWRKRQDNLWAMGPLDNLVGMQYRIDHIENLKADVFDLITFPPLKIKGYVEDFKWGPMERIIVGDDGDVEMMAPPFQVLQANTEISMLEQKMEEMAGSPKEAMGFRTPGEKTKYEVQRLENAAARVFQNKIGQFEEQLVERVLNAMLELARRKMSGVTEVRVFDDEFKINVFKELSAQDITGSGRIRPVAARHFAEQAEVIQNITNFFGSPIGQNPAFVQHFSGVKTAKMIESLLSIEEYELVEPYIQITEQAESQRLAHAAEEQVLMEAGTPTGLTEDDYDEDMDQPQGAPVGGEELEPAMDEAPQL